MPSAVAETLPMVPETTPSLPSLLTNTEKPWLAVATPATVASRVISATTSLNSAFRVVREAVEVWPEAAWVASVASRSSSFEMLSSAPSLIWRSDKPSLALRTPWLMMAMSERYELATARPAASSPE